MKRLSFVFIITWSLCYNLSAFAALTVEDLDKIREIVNESEARMEKNLSDVEKRLSDKFQTLDKHFRERLTFHGSLIIALIIAIIGFVSVPMGFITFQYFKIRAQQEDEIKALREKIQALETQLLVENQD
ncbi:MAG: hypothetical protein OXM61_13310 [Candidatus Poribacteria bacterium]|nr:hypothetical protein [Candidatus Poribacteria bacterium]